MGMDCLRKIGKYAAIPAAAISLYLAEPIYTNSESAAHTREWNAYVTGLEEPFSPEDRLGIERFERKFAFESNQAELSWKVISPYVKRYKRLAREFGIPLYMGLGQAAAENSDYKAIAKRAEKLGISFDDAYRSMRSKAGAKGALMVRKLVAEKIGDLIVHKLKDDRENPEEVTRTGFKYLRSLKEEFGSWGPAYTAYWMGPTAMRKKGVNKEYFYKIAALAHIFEDPDEHGVTLKDRKIEYSPWKPKDQKAQKGKPAPRKNVPVRTAYRK